MSDMMKQAQQEQAFADMVPATMKILKKRADFLQARNGARSHGRAFVLQGFARQDHVSDIRIGYTVTKKVGNSVERNRIRRRLREAVKAASRSGNTRLKLAGRDIVVIARRAALTLPFSQLVHDLENGFKQLIAKRTPKGQKQRQQSSANAVTGNQSKLVT